jgi:hypothetical protein
VVLPVLQAAQVEAVAVPLGLDEAQQLDVEITRAVEVRDPNLGVAGLEDVAGPLRDGHD